MARVRSGQLALMICGTVALAGCEEGKDFNLFKQNTGAEVTADAPLSSSSVKLIERDIEAPDVFQVSEQGLWDGRPSLGGVWVAAPGVKEPERVIIRNEDNGKFVIGALFRRERDNPGPKLQVSSDAAAALGMLAGAPDVLNVTALRREEVPLAQDTPAPETTMLEAPEEIETATLDPIAAASAAIDAAEPQPTPTQVAAVAPAAPVRAAAPSKPSGLAKPFIQIGLFSVEENASNTGIALRGAGMVPTIQKNESRGKTYWRVTVGPASNVVERTALLGKVKDLGFTDAYFVTN